MSGRKNLDEVLAEFGMTRADLETDQDLAYIREAVVIHPGDTVIVSVGQQVSAVDAQRARDLLRAKLPECAVVVVAAAQIAVLRQEGAPMTDAQREGGQESPAERPDCRCEIGTCKDDRQAYRCMWSEPDTELPPVNLAPYGPDRPSSLRGGPIPLRGQRVDSGQPSQPSGTSLPSAPGALQETATDSGQPDQAADTLVWQPLPTDTRFEFTVDGKIVRWRGRPEPDQAAEVCTCVESCGGVDRAWCKPGCPVCFHLRAEPDQPAESYPEESTSRPGYQEPRSRGGRETAHSCPHGDATCPCPDGDQCHYEAEPDQPDTAAIRRDMEGDAFNDNRAWWQVLSQLCDALDAARRDAEDWEHAASDRGVHGLVTALREARAQVAALTAEREAERQRHEANARDQGRWLERAEAERDALRAQLDAVVLGACRDLTAVEAERDALRAKVDAALRINAEHNSAAGGFSGHCVCGGCRMAAVLNGGTDG